MAKQRTPLVLPPRKPASPPPVVYTKDTVPSLEDDPQPDMSDGKAYAAWCMRQKLRKERGIARTTQYTVDNVPSLEDDPMPTRGPGYGEWCTRQNLRRLQLLKYGPEASRVGAIERARKVLVQQTIGYLYSLSERKLNDAFGSLHGEMDQEAWDAWLEDHPTLKTLIGTRG